MTIDHGAVSGATARTDDAGVTSGGRTRWYRRRSLLLTVVVVAVVAVSVVTDLPEHATRSANISSAKALLQEVNGDVEACGYAVEQAFAIDDAEVRDDMSAADRANVPALLRDDQSACSFTSSSIYDLSTIEPPSSSSGKDLSTVVGTLVQWTSGDGLGAIEAVQTLDSDPRDTKALASLAGDERALASDRASAEAALSAADRDLATRLPSLAIPALEDPPR